MSTMPPKFFRIFIITYLGGGDFMWCFSETTRDDKNNPKVSVWTRV